MNPVSDAQGFNMNNSNELGRDEVSKIIQSCECVCVCVLAYACVCAYQAQDRGLVQSVSDHREATNCGCVDKKQDDKSDSSIRL